MRKIDRFGMISTVAGNGQCGYNGDNILATLAQVFFCTEMKFTLQTLEIIELEKCYKME